ncbi:MAG: hypothetical protein JJU21_09770 [Salinarimonas sp.]|nr:hypothetical protein [Salinarimonas sp.]
MNRSGTITDIARAPSPRGWPRAVMRRAGVVVLLYAFALSGFLAGTLLAAQQAHALGEPGIHCLLEAGHHHDPHGAARHKAECLSGCPVPPAPPLPPAPDATILGFDARSVARIALSGLREQGDLPAAPVVRAYGPRGPPVLIVLV